MARVECGREVELLNQRHIVIGGSAKPHAAQDVGPRNISKKAAVVAVGGIVSEQVILIL